MLLLILGFIILIFSVILHEIAHGWVADRLGDPTPKSSGRLTLNPLPHIDPFMSIILPLFLIITGSPVVFGSAKPVPIDPFNLKQGRKDMGLVGLAGPATNIFLAIAAVLIFKLVSSSVSFSDSTFLFLSILKLTALYNVLLAALNLVPIPPLDGSRILAAILPEEFARYFDLIEPYGLFILLFLLFFPTGTFSLSRFIYDLAIFWLTLLGLQ